MGKGRRREATALVIGQPEAASRPLFLEDAVLLHQVLDDALMTRCWWRLTHPARVTSREESALIGRPYPESGNG